MAAISKPIIKNVLIVYRDKSQSTIRKVNQVKKCLQSHNIAFKPIAQSALNSRFFDKKLYHLLIILGGDGTYLHTVHCVQDHSIPFLGINIGSLGFLTVHREELIEHCLGAALNGTMCIEYRTLINVKVKKHRRTIKQYIALNDIVIERGAFSHLINVSVAIQNHNIYSIKADGLIVSSPTGSTAYNLASGGPILHPEVRSFVITPICSHSLTHRPVVVPDTCVMSFCMIHKNQNAFLTIDGKRVLSMSDTYQIIISRSTVKHKTLRFKDYSYFLLLKDKLQFSK